MPWKILWLLFAIAASPVFGSGQASETQAADASTGSDATAELLKKVDQLVDQNIQLEKQNRELMEEIGALRRVVGKRPSETAPTLEKAVVETVPPEASTSQPPAPQSAAQSSGQNPSQDNDDKTLLPEASDGNPAIFGEFNPGRGFTVAQGEFGKLDLSGYMVARYLNQLPPDQTGTDHLGRPIAIAPRNDFQFHRIMLFSQ
jgi:hypothetical protein